MLEVDPAEAGPDAVRALKEAFDYANPQHAKMQRLGFWVGNTPRRIRDFEEAEGVLRLPRGGTDKVRRVLRARGVEAAFCDRRLALPAADYPILPGAEPAEDRDYQARMIEAALRLENCLIRGGTGCGKTEVLLELIRRTRQPALVIVWEKPLLEQWVERICKRWGWAPRDVGWYGGGKKRVGQVTVAMQQTLARPGAVEELAPRFGTVVCDEVHRFAARTFREVISRFPARYRVGASADERRKDRLDFLIRHQFGRVAEEVDRKELILAGRVCEVEVVLVPTDFHFAEIEEGPPAEMPERKAEHYTAMLNAMETDDDRNHVAVRLAVHEHARGSHVLVWCERREQAASLARYIALVEDVPCGLMLGSAGDRARFNETKERLVAGELRCAVGGKNTYTGMDIERLDVGVVVTPTTSNRQLFEQQMGRLRRPFPGKGRARAYVLWDPGIFPDAPDNLRRWYGSRLVSIRELGDIVG